MENSSKVSVASHFKVLPSHLPSHLPSLSDMTMEGSRKLSRFSMKS